MENCLDGNQVAGYVDYLCYGADVPEAEVVAHVRRCIRCKEEVMVVFDIVYKIGIGLRLF